MKQGLKEVLPLIVLFIILNGCLLSSKTLLMKWGIDREVLLAANFLFFLISFIAFLMQQSGLKNKNPNVFIRRVMGSMMLRMFMVLIALGIYIFVAGKMVNKPAIYISLVFYMLYMFAEVMIIMKLNRQSNG